MLSFFNAFRQKSSFIVVCRGDHNKKVTCMLLFSHLRMQDTLQTVSKNTRTTPILTIHANNFVHMNMNNSWHLKHVRRWCWCVWFHSQYGLCICIESIIWSCEFKHMPFPYILFLLFRSSAILRYDITCSAFVHFYTYAGWSLYQLLLTMPTASKSLPFSHSFY